MDISVDLGCHRSVLSYHLHLFIFETKVEWVGGIDFYFLLILRKNGKYTIPPLSHEGVAWHAHWDRVNILPQINSPSQTPLLNCESPEHLRIKDDQKSKVRISFEWYNILEARRTLASSSPDAPTDLALSLGTHLHRDKMLHRGGRGGWGWHRAAAAHVLRVEPRLAAVRRVLQYPSVISSFVYLSR